MLKFLFCILSMLVIGTPALAQQVETITLVTPVAPSHSNTAISLKLIEKANFLQSKYNFAIEYKPGANGIVGIKYMDMSPSNRIAGVNPAFATNINKGLIKESNYVPITANGDVCWALISNIGNTSNGVASLSSLKGKEVIVGGNGIGNAAHITALMLGEKYGFRVKYIVFKSNFDAIVNMAGNNGVNMALESINTYHQFKEKQPNLQMLGLNCPIRNKSTPKLKTLQEQGVRAPTIFNMVMANKAMPIEKRKEISAILDQAVMAIGATELEEAGGYYPPIFQNVKIEDFAHSRISNMKELVAKYQVNIDSQNAKSETKLTLIGKQ